MSPERSDSLDSHQSKADQEFDLVPLVLFSVALVLVLGLGQLYLTLRIDRAQISLDTQRQSQDQVHHAISTLRRAARNTHAPGHEVLRTGEIREQQLQFIRHEKDLLAATRNFQLEISSAGSAPLADIRMRELLEARENLLHFARQAFAQLGKDRREDAEAAVKEMDLALEHISLLLDRVEDSWCAACNARVHSLRQSLDSMRSAYRVTGLFQLLFLIAALILGPVSYRRIKLRMSHDHALARRYEALNCAPGLAVAELDRELCCVAGNEQWVRWTTGESERWEGDEWRRNVEQSQVRMLTEQISSLQQRRGQEIGELWIGTPNQPGSTLLHVYAAALPGEQHVLLLAADVTSRQRLVNELCIAIDSARRLSSNKDQVLAGMGHELRTPLNAIIGFTELLTEELNEQVDEQKLKDLGNIRDTAIHLLGIINKILDLSSLQAGAMASVIEIVPLKRIMEPITAQAKSLAARQGNVFELNDEVGDLPIETDATHLRQILLNLIGNACKFTEHGTISLRVRQVRKQHRQMLELAVIDTGIGIPQKDLGRLFSPFYQSGNSGRMKRQGTGLGLSISMNLAELLGGRLTAESEEGRGSTFLLTIPTDGPSQRNL